MSAHHGRIATVLVAGLLLLTGSALGSYAANGGPLLLGKKNTESKTTVLTNVRDHGSALHLKSDSGSAPLAVSNSTKILKLNADLLDGADSAALQTRAWSYTLSGTSGASNLRFALPGLPAGKYHASYTVNATAPSASSVSCVFEGPPGANPRLTSFGVDGGGGIFSTSASGLLDTTQRAYTLACFSNAGSLTIPASGGVAPAVVTLTRIDSLTEAASAGTTSRGH